MNHTDLQPHIAAIFGAPRSRSTRVAVEQEHFAIDTVRGGTAPPDRVRDALAGRPYADLVSFEPGGQVEIPLPPAPDPTTLSGSLASITHAVRADLAAHEVALVVAPVLSLEQTPRYLHSSRYDAMEAHFDTIGPAGRWMMRATASTQVCLDWWPGRAGLEQWRTLLLAGPFLAAAVCDWSSGRLPTWLEVDPARTAFDDRLLHGDNPVAAYVDFAARAPAFVSTPAEHVSTLFPPVRPRAGYLEVRFPDARPADEVGALVAGLARLIYDDERRRRVLGSLRSEQHRLGDHWRAAASGQLDPERGRSFLAEMIPTVVAA